jgi:FKBP-type peptidyl-prolyl cis-trans isomerase (trigger factor)
MESAIKSVKSRLVYEYLFDKLNITLTKKEYNEKLEAFYNENKIYYMYYFGITDVDGVEEYFGKETLEMEFEYDKLSEKLLDHITIVD